MPKNKVLIKSSVKYNFLDFLKSQIDNLTFKNLERLSRKHIAEGLPQLNIRAFDFLGHCINMQGIYERRSLELVFKYLKKHSILFSKTVALDVGANIGNHSLFFSNYFEKIVAFEPHPLNYKLIELNSSLSSKKNIEIYNSGISDQYGEMTISCVDVANSGSFSLNNTPSISSDTLVIVNTLDNLCNGRHISLIKIDVEGMELNVIKGASNIILQYQPVILFEQKHSNFSEGNSDVILQLAKLGYTKFGFVKHAMTPIASRSFLVAFMNGLYFSLFKKLTDEFILTTSNGILPGDYNFIVALPDWAV
jgi:FkbM family methyltransferase